MNHLLSFLPADGWQRLLCDTLWQSTLIGTAGWVVARFMLRHAATKSWVLLLTISACAITPLVSLAARTQGWTVLAAEKNGADSLPAVGNFEVVEDLAGQAQGLQPPGLERSVTVDTAPSIEIAEAVSPVPTEIIESVPAAKAVDRHASSVPSPFSALAIAWLFLSAVLLVRFALSLLATRRLLRAAKLCDDANLLAAAENAARRVGLRKPVRLYCSERISTPMVLAFGAPRLLVPAGTLAYARGSESQSEPRPLGSDFAFPHVDWTAAFTHELAHVVRGDGWSRLWAEFVSIALPLSPLVWILKHGYRTACEEACDDWVIATGTDPADFAATLTNWIKTPHQKTPLPAMGISGTKSRLVRILSIKDKPMTHLIRTWRLAGIVVGLACIGTIAFAQRNSEKSTPNKSRPNPDSSQPAANQTPRVDNVQQTLDGGEVQRQISDLEKQAAELQKRIEGLRALEINPPSEKTGRISLPPYVIEPPDILQIDPVRLVLKEPFKIAPQDKLTLAVEGTKLALPIRGIFNVDNSGEIALGPGYGSAHVEGLTRREAEAAITEQLKETLVAPEVSVTVDESRLAVGIAGRHLIGPDGTISLGPYGSQYVSGETILQAQKAVEEKLSKWFKDPIVAINVYAYKSKIYYVISDSGGRDEHAQRFPITGNETVLDAISQIPNLGQVSDKEIWIARPRAGGKDQILKVVWNDIISGAGTNTNYQVLPGDRVVISRKPSGDAVPPSESEAPKEKGAGSTDARSATPKEPTDAKSGSKPVAPKAEDAGQSSADGSEYYGTRRLKQLNSTSPGLELLDRRPRALDSEPYLDAIGRESALRDRGDRRPPTFHTPGGRTAK